MHDENRWPVWKLALLLYVFAAGAVGINLFMLGLLGQWMGLPALSPFAATSAGLALGFPAALLAGRWARSLLDLAENQV